MISILLADDQPLLRAGFAMLIDAEVDMEVIGEATSGTDVVHQALQLKPDVILMDVRMPGMDGIEATRRILESGSGSRILILTTFDLDEYAYRGLRAGASGFLLKDVSPERLISAIRAVASGDAVVSLTTTRRLLGHYSAQSKPVAKAAGEDPRLASLTEREREVLFQLAAGKSNSEIAEDLVVSEPTVKTHVGKVLAKLDLRDRVQAVVFAYENGLVTPGE